MRDPSPSNPAHLPSDWGASWIGSGAACVHWNCEPIPAPLLRRRFTLDAAPSRATLLVSGLGYHDLYLNGERATDDVLQPVVTQYTHRVAFNRLDVTHLLRAGDNAIGVVLGNGWYNCWTPEVWHFDKADWRDFPKLLLRLDANCNGETRTVVSDTDWKVAEGPIRFDALRNGEHYDARHEIDGWTAIDFDDAAWQPAARVAPPPGVLEEQVSPPCRVHQTLEPVAVADPEPGVKVFDLGRNIAGWARVTAAGGEGETLTLRYSERIHEDGRLDQHEVARFIKSGDPQTDRYTFAGGAAKTWEPRFTFHGFQYVQAEGPPHVLDSLELEGRVVHNDMPEVGTFTSSDDRLNRIHEITGNAYRGHFVTLPMDCPHREKNGWTGDAQLAAEFGLLHFDASTSYEQWLITLADTQRPSGQLPGIAPSAGWGYNWGSGPAWDSALLLIPWYLYLYRGRTRAIERHYPAMRKYIEFCRHMSPDHIADFGLGDWCHVDDKRAAPRALTSTAYYFVDATLLATFAELLGKSDEAARYRDLAEAIRAAFHEAFYKGDGLYAGGEQTAQAAALFQGLTPDSERGAVVQRLVEAVENNDNKPDFGILGSKYVPRALADHGHADLAYRLITQPQYPGYVHWLHQGATTLWEDWPGERSRNHVMFGDVSAWMVNYLAGIRPDPAGPGFQRCRIEPCFVEGLDRVDVSHDAPTGRVAVKWSRSPGGSIDLRVDIPSGSVATLALPGEADRELAAGAHRIDATGNASVS